jgi:hypothetical protein
LTPDRILLLLLLLLLLLFWICNADEQKLLLKK